MTVKIIFNIFNGLSVCICFLDAINLCARLKTIFSVESSTAGPYFGPAVLHHSLSVLKSIKSGSSPQQLTHPQITYWLETNFTDATAPHVWLVDLFIDDPCPQRVAGIYCYSRVIAPSLRTIAAGVIKSGTGKQCAAAWNGVKGVGVQPSREPYLCMCSGIWVCRCPGYVYIIIGVCCNRCIPVIRRGWCGDDAALDDRIHCGIELIEFRFW